MIDLHGHWLPDVDDGADGMDESIAMLRIARRDGTRVVVATPHQLHPAGYHVPPDLARERLRSVADAAGKEGLDLRLELGAEIHFSEEITAGLREGALTSLGPNGKYFLLELPVTAVPGNIFEAVFEFQMAGFFPILAHPERNVEVIGRPEIARELRERGVFVQLTAMSITGGFGRGSAKASKKLLKWGVVDVIASDSHDANGRPPGLCAALERAERIVGRESAERMVTETPARILRGEGID